VTTTSSPTAEEVRALLARGRAGDAGARDALFALCYEDLRRVAARAFRGERRDHTSAPTALVHEVWLRMAAGGLDARDRRELLNVAALAMRRMLVDSARRRRLKPEGEIGDPACEATAPAPALERLESALAALDAADAELAEVVRLRFLAGLSVEETARLLGISAPTVTRRWRVARAFLRRRMEAER
jgi:RNA polymerase sigma factor (TIGR02999 family)